MKTNKNITLNALKGRFSNNIGMENEKIDIESLNDAIYIQVMNDYELYSSLTNKRKKITAIAWEGFLKVANGLIEFEGYSCKATSSHLKSYINNDYNVLNDVCEQLEEERKELLESC
ncbi:hypothetical protein [Clostridium perfringens]|uniref:hypothetical protein n=1 Tax=Clostridium perfringens TaxID=1502 RepID=UPI001E5E13EB|nr:hypothetical protein [Clostridium perfringens]WVL78356.1 hypothetical protein LMS42_014855 [Clostridium perfringens]